MPSLKNSIISEILDNLDRGNFCREGFIINFPDRSSTLAKLVFSSLTKYEFEIQEYITHGNRFDLSLTYYSGSEEKNIRTIESPGDYKNNEYHECDNISDAVNRVNNWVKNIREDLIHS